MEKYQMNRPGCRQNRQVSMPAPAPMPCKAPAPMPCRPDRSMFDHVDHMVPAMAYVPYQSWQQPFELRYALSVGTIFPDLCKPFCGRRVTNRC
ncbi:MAG: spore coat associated protein CotJA [Blautia sp.]